MTRSTCMLVCALAAALWTTSAVDAGESDCAHYYVQLDIEEEIPFTNLKQNDCFKIQLASRSDEAYGYWPAARVVWDTSSCGTGTALLLAYSTYQSDPIIPVCRGCTFQCGVVNNDVIEDINSNVLYLIANVSGTTSHANGTIDAFVARPLQSWWASFAYLVIILLLIMTCVMSCVYCYRLSHRSARGQNTMRVQYITRNNGMSDQFVWSPDLPPDYAIVRVDSTVDAVTAAHVPAHDLTKPPPTYEQIVTGGDAAAGDNAATRPTTGAVDTPNDADRAHANAAFHQDD